MLIIRVDDCGWGTEHCIDKNMKEYRAFHKLFADRNIPYCAGVIPAVCSEEMILWMKDNFYSGVSTFLHGWEHKSLEINKAAGVRASTEFRGLDLTKQKQLIKNGLTKLECLRPIGFIPPFNCYDNNTIQACIDFNLIYFLVGAEERTGFIEGPERKEKYRKHSGVYVIPENIDLYFTGDFSKALKNIEYIKKIPQSNYPNILSLHCVWEYPNIKGKALPLLLDTIQDKVNDIRDFKE